MKVQKKYLFAVRTTNATIGIEAHSSFSIARREALRELGTTWFGSVRYATAQDIEWVQAMGGYIPNGVISGGR